MRAKAVLTMLGGAMGLAVLALVTTSGSTPLLSAPPEPGGGQGGALGLPGGLESGPTAAPTTAAATQGSGPDTSSVIDTVLIVAVGVTVLIVAGWLILDRRSTRAELRRQERRQDALPEFAEQMAKDAQAQLGALREGTPRNAIVGCWLQLEESVRAAGLDRDQAETSAEFTERVLSSYAVDDAAITRLAALYREARFSEHLLGEESRRAAAESLEQLHVDLRRTVMSA